MEEKEEKEPPDSSRKPAPEHEISFKQEASLLLRPETREEVMGGDTGEHVGWRDSE